ncbi:MAG: STAS domain-containing protein [Burkholderiaceae bacterium]
MSSPDSVVDFTLPSEFGIYAAAQTQQALAAALTGWPEEGQRTVLGLKGDAVETLDASGVQLLMALHRSLDARGLELRILDASDPLRHGLERLGTRALLACCH